MLIDDVLTSGATADTCARALLRAGAAHVDVLVFARVVAPHARHHIKGQKKRTPQKHHAARRHLHHPLLPLLRPAKALLKRKGVAFNEIDVERAIGSGAKR